MGSVEAKCECNNCRAAAAGFTAGLCDRVYEGMMEGKSFSEMIDEVYGKGGVVDDGQGQAETEAAS